MDRYSTKVNMYIYTFVNLCFNEYMYKLGIMLIPCDGTYLYLSEQQFAQNMSVAVIYATQYVRYIEC